MLQEQVNTLKKNNGQAKAEPKPKANPGKQKKSMKHLLCKRFLKGTCPFGKDCWYSHDKNLLNTKDPYAQKDNQGDAKDKKGKKGPWWKQGNGGVDPKKNNTNQRNAEKADVCISPPTETLMFCNNENIPWLLDTGASVNVGCASKHERYVQTFKKERTNNLTNCKWNCTG